MKKEKRVGNRKKINIKEAFMYIDIAFCVILALGFLTFEIILFITYGNKPAGEVPTWALWFMFRGGR